MRVRNRYFFFIGLALLFLALPIRAEDGAHATGDTTTQSAAPTRPTAPTVDPKSVPTTLRELAERVGGGVTPARIADAVERLKTSLSDGERKEAADALVKLLKLDGKSLFDKNTQIDLAALLKLLGLDPDTNRFKKEVDAILEAIRPKPSPSPTPGAAASPSPTATGTTTPTGTTGTATPSGSPGPDVPAPIHVGGPGASPDPGATPSVEPTIEPVPSPPGFDPGTFDPGLGFDPNQQFNPFDPNNLNNNLNDPNNIRNRRRNNRGNRGRNGDNAGNAGNNQDNGAGNQDNGNNDQGQQNADQTPSSGDSGGGGDGSGGGGGGKGGQTPKAPEMPKFQLPPEFKPPEAGPEPTIDPELAKAISGYSNNGDFWKRMNNSLDQIEKTIQAGGDAQVKIVTEGAKAFVPTPSLGSPRGISNAGGAGWSGGGGTESLGGLGFAGTAGGMGGKGWNYPQQGRRPGNNGLNRFRGL